MNKEQFITQLDKLLPNKFGLQLKIVTMAEEYAQSLALQQTNVMWPQSGDPLPCCSKCGMPGQPLGTRCLAEDCPGAQQVNGT